VLATLAHCDGHKQRAAQILGISLKTLYNRLNAYKQSRAQRVVMMEGARRSLAPGTHPLDHTRAGAAASFLLQTILKMPNASKDKELLGTYRQLIALADKIDKEGASTYFAVIDKESQEVNLASLKVGT